MAELADAPDLSSGSGSRVRVQVSSGALGNDGKAYILASKARFCRFESDFSNYDLLVELEDTSALEADALCMRVQISHRSLTYTIGLLYT